MKLNPVFKEGTTEAEKHRLMKDLSTRINTKYVIEGNCWRWISTVSSGRPQIRIQGRYIYASRAMYVLKKGAIPEGMLVLHTCDNGLCVNPDHLWLGTFQDNTIDAIRKDRFKHM
jgi:hypothetical protein